MKYPMCAVWLVFHKTNTGDYLVEDILGDTKMMLSEDAVRFLRKLNGARNPYHIDPMKDRKTVERLLKQFERRELIRTSRFVSKNILAVIYTVFFFHNRKGAAAIIAKGLNTVLYLLFLPMFLFGSLLYVKYGDTDWNLILAGVYIGLVIGMVLHEAGHAVAGMAYGAKMIEAGVMLRLLLPGAYVMMDDRPVKLRLQRVQIYAAGVEMNLLLAGTAFLLASIRTGVGGLFLGAAIQNVILAALNMVFIRGLDGEKMLSALLRKRDFVEKAASVERHFGKKAAPGKRQLWLRFLCVYCSLHFRLWC